MIKPGDRVKMSEECKQRMSLSSIEHINEFGNCEGIVIGLTNYNKIGEPFDSDKVGSEFDVRWLPSNLIYCYHPDDLVVITPQNI